MKINLKARLKNKTFVISAVTLCVSFIYKLLGLAGVVPAFSEYEVMSLFDMLTNTLALAGVLVDPTTEGFSDSDSAMTYCTDCDERFSEVKK